MLFHLARHRPPIVVVASCVLVIAGCGGSSKPSSPSTSASNLTAQGIKFADCMRSHGVPNYPDPTRSIGPVGAFFGVKLGSGTGINTASPAFQAAQKACAKLEPGGPESRQSTAAFEQQLFAVAKCMRAHGVSGFPDPTTKPPGTPTSGGFFMQSRSGVSLVIPNSINLQSPAVKQAAAACHFRLPGAG